MSVRRTLNIVPLKSPICVVLLGFAFGSKIMYLIVKAAESGSIVLHFMGSV